MYGLNNSKTHKCPHGFFLKSICLNISVTYFEPITICSGKYRLTANLLTLVYVGLCHDICRKSNITMSFSMKHESAEIGKKKLSKPKYLLYFVIHYLFIFKLKSARTKLVCDLMIVRL